MFMLIFSIILICFCAIAITRGYNATGSYGIVLIVVILGIRFLIKYIYAIRKCHVCGERGGVYKMPGDVSNDTTHCKYCEEIENKIKATRNADLRCQREKERKEEREEEGNIKTLLSKTCPHCNKYNKDWDEIKKIYQSETINGDLYQRIIYIRKCIYCSYNDDRISDWI